MAQLLHQPRSSGDNVPGSGAVSSLIAMADYFLTQNPQRVRLFKCFFFGRREELTKNNGTLLIPMGVSLVVGSLLSRG